MLMELWVQLSSFSLSTVSRVSSVLTHFSPVSSSIRAPLKSIKLSKIFPRLPSWVSARWLLSRWGFSGKILETIRPQSTINISPTWNVSVRMFTFLLSDLTQWARMVGARKELSGCCMGEMSPATCTTTRRKYTHMSSHTALPYLIGSPHLASIGTFLVVHMQQPGCSDAGMRCGLLGVREYWILPVSHDVMTWSSEYWVIGSIYSSHLRI